MFRCMQKYYHEYAYCSPGDTEKCKATLFHLKNSTTNLRHPIPRQISRMKNYLSTEKISKTQYYLKKKRRWCSSNIIYDDDIKCHSDTLLHVLWQKRQFCCDCCCFIVVCSLAISSFYIYFPSLNPSSRIQNGNSYSFERIRKKLKRWSVKIHL